MKTKMLYHDALKIAEQVQAQIEPYCERVAIAGSIRRKADYVGDIEIVCIPKTVPTLNLLGDVAGLRNLLLDFLPHSGWSYLSGQDHHRQYSVTPEISMDLFMTSADSWGVIYMIRTGSADFAKWMVTQRNKGGALPSNLVVRNGRVWLGDLPMSLPEEEDYFSLCQVPYITPVNRREGNWKW